eukprot:scaffold47725_cov28-Tisochrysis_lutea.AAC.1
MDRPSTSTDELASRAPPGRSPCRRLRRCVRLEFGCGASARPEGGTPRTAEHGVDRPAICAPTQRPAFPPRAKARAQGEG